MNAKDRAVVAKIIAELEGAQAKVQELGGQLRDPADAEQEKYDNLSEGLQGSDKGTAIQDAADALSAAADGAEDGEIGTALEALGNVEW